MLIFGQLNEHFHLNMESNSWIKQDRHSMSIKRIQSNDPLSQSKDLVQDSIEKLKALFPQIVTEDKIDFNVLKEILGEEVEHGEEYYRFTWAGKTQARREAHKPSTGTLIPVKEESLDWETTQNLYIEGDNLEVLKLLQKSYAEKVKMIYIDPPYNTGSDFVYKDNYGDNLRNYQEFTGQLDSEGNRLSTNSDSDGRYHSNWLNMMYPRLILAKNLLRDDGMIFISIDDHEAENLKKICSEIFGTSNFVGQFTWETKRAARGVPPSNLLMHNHEYILCYSKKNDMIKLKGLKREKSDFSNPDNDPRGIWRSESIKATGKQDNYFEIIDKNTGNKYMGNWAFSEKSIQSMIEKNLIIFPKKKTGVPRQKKFFNSYKNETKAGVTSLGWYSTENSTKYLMGLFNNQKIFDHPKPRNLIRYIIDQTLGKEDIILDFFSGSATVADALYDHNLMEQLKCQYILVQLPEDIQKKKPAFKAGYKTISEIGRERIRRVIQQIKESYPEKSEAMDLGFKVFRLDSSNINAWDGSPENLKANLFNAVNSIKSGRDEEDVLYEVLLKYGLDLTASIEQRLIERERVYKIYGGGQNASLSV